MDDWTFNLSEAREFINRLVAENPHILDHLNVETHNDGINQEFLDKLDRVDKSKLTPQDDCPICANAFLDDQYPLVVALPCPGRHRFDLDCVGPWLLKHKTCPMCRHDVSTRKQIEVPEDSEEEYDDMFA